ASELRHMPKPVSLHVVISDLDHQFGPQSLPGKILSLAPAALPARQTLSGRRAIRRPLPPRVTGQSVLPVRVQNLLQFQTPGHRKTRADPDMLQRAAIVKQTEQKRSDLRPVPRLMPPKARHYAIAIAFMFDLQHDAL